MQIKHIIAAWLLTGVIAVNAQTQIDPALRLMLGQTAHDAPSADRTLNRNIAVYIQFDENAIDWEAIEQLGGQVGTIAGRLATVHLPLTALQSLAEVEGVTYIQAPQQAHLMLDLARKEALADAAQQVTNPLTGLNYTGQGIVIGQVDAGLDYMHNAFRSADGTLRIKRVWEQGTDAATASIAGLKAPAVYGYGAEFDTPELILRAGGDTDAGSHGTHVMGIAAGSDTWMDGQFHGLATEAELVMVAIDDVGPDNVCISDAIQYIFDYADQVGKPCVINLSLGSHSGPHDGTSPFDQIADALQGPGRLIVGAAGNYGIDKFHLCRTFTADEEQQPFQVIVRHDFYSSYRTGSIDIWADASLPLTIELFDYSTFNLTETETAQFSLPNDIDGEVHEISLGRNVTGTIQLCGEVNPVNGKQHVLLTSLLTNLRNNHVVGLRIVPQGGYGQVDLWADNAKIKFNAAAHEGFVNPVDESTITEIGGTASRILSVGAYTTRDEFVLEGDNEAIPVYGQTLNGLCDFSGFGPTADGRMKPEVCAPGSFIVSSVSGHDRTGSLYMHSHYIDDNGHEQRYGYLHGTSMSAPFVTGAVALWLQAYPNMTPEDLKEIIASTSRQDDFTADERYWGYGKIDVLAGLRRSIELGGGNAISQVETPLFGPTRIFDASGRQVTTPTHGIYIIKVGNQSRKVSVK